MKTLAAIFFLAICAVVTSIYTDVVFTGAQPPASGELPMLVGQSHATLGF